MLRMTGLLALLLLVFASPLLAEQAMVSINDDSAETLAKGLKGIGLKKARSIVAYRDKNSPYTTVEDLTLVKGVGGRAYDH